jgi:hypothetical protein
LKLKNTGTHNEWANRLTRTGGTNGFIILGIARDRQSKYNSKQDNEALADSLHLKK